MFNEFLTTNQIWLSMQNFGYLDCKLEKKQGKQSASFCTEKHPTKTDLFYPPGSFVRLPDEKFSPVIFFLPRVQLASLYGREIRGSPSVSFIFVHKIRHHEFLVNIHIEDYIYSQCVKCIVFCKREFSLYIKYFQSSLSNVFYFESL